MTKEDALKKVHHGSIIVYEYVGAINAGYVQNIFENGTIEVCDIVDGKVGASVLVPLTSVMSRAFLKTEL